MEHPQLTQLKKLARLMDSQFTGPFGIRFGLDALIGLVPFLGDIITGLISLFIIFRSAQMGSPPLTLVRMAINVTLDIALTGIPFLGNLADFCWRANDRNIALLEQTLRRPQQTARQSMLIFAGIVAVISCALIASLYLALSLAQALVELFGKLG